jgi:hypothetical protein
MADFFLFLTGEIHPRSGRTIEEINPLLPTVAGS